MNWKRIGTGILRITGLRICIASLVPMVTAAVMAYDQTLRFPVKWVLLSFAGILLIETGKHCLNDIVDYRSGVDLSIEPDKATPYSGGKKVLTEHLLTVKEAAVIGVVFLTLAAVIGVAIALHRGPLIWLFGILGVFFACAYSLPPFSLCYRGLGEIAVGITYGPLLFLGMYTVITGAIDKSAVLVSIPFGILIMNVLWINQYPDYEADLKHHKKNWVVRLGKQKSLLIYAICFIFAYCWFALLAVLTKNPLWLIAFAGIPLACSAYRTASRYYRDIPRMMKANQMTIQVYMITGLAVMTTIVLSK